ncbi:MAG TPA: glycoside hydrolase family 76 protein [Lacipirellula sp.]
MLLLLAFGWVDWSCASAVAKESPPTSDELGAWGAETLLCIERDYRVSRGQEVYFAEEYSERAHRRPPAFMWSSGVHLSALAAAARFDRQQYEDDLIARIESLEPYWTRHEGVDGYDVLPRPTSSDRYYDDNAWIALTLLEAYHLARDAAHLKRAREIHEFLLSGMDEQLGGGIYWRENEKTSKNTCINAPAALVALRLYQATEKPEYFDTGLRLYEWTRTKLQDPSTGLYWDNIDLDGEIDRRQFSYNSALMIRTALALHAITGEEVHLREARRVAKASVARWIVRQTGAVRDGSQFAHLLLDALLELAAVDGDRALTDVVLRSAAYVHTLRDEHGRYPRRWDQPPTAPRRRYELIHQASAARLFFSAAIAIRE